MIAYSEDSVEGCVFRILLAVMCIALAFFLEHGASNNIQIDETGNNRKVEKLSNGEEIVCTFC